MPAVVDAKEPFHFQTRLHLKELTGLKAIDLSTLVQLMKTVPGSCIYYHTHHFLQQHQFLSPEPPNDFAYWTTEVFGESALGEKLASIDTVQYHTIRDLRNKLVETIETYIQEHTHVVQRNVREAQAFHFMRAVSFVLPANYTAYNLVQFAEILSRITVNSLYYHVFEARLRIESPTNDFAYWVESSLGDKELAKKMKEVDPYTHTLESLRKKLVHMVLEKIEEQS